MIPRAEAPSEGEFIAGGGDEMCQPREGQMLSQDEIQDRLDEARADYLPLERRGSQSYLDPLTRAWLGEQRTRIVALAEVLGQEPFE